MPITDPTEAQLQALDQLTTDALMERLAVVGGEVNDLDTKLKAKQTERLALYSVLDRRDVSYRLIAKEAGVSDVAVLRLLQRYRERVKKVVLGS